MTSAPVQHRDATTDHAAIAGSHENIAPALPTNTSPSLAQTTATATGRRTSNRLSRTPQPSGNIMLAVLGPSTRTSCSPCWSPRPGHRARQARAIDSNPNELREDLVAPLSRALLHRRQRARTEAHPAHCSRPPHQASAIPHILILKIRGVSTPRQARPGPPYVRPGRARTPLPHRAGTTTGWI